MPCAGKDGGSLNKVEMIQAPKGKSSWGNLIRQGTLKLAMLYEVRSTTPSVQNVCRDSLVIWT